MQSSAGSGVEPRWSADGRRLFDRADGAFRVATLSETKDSLVVVRRDSLFADPDPPFATGDHQYDVHPDGKQFVMVRRTGSEDVYELAAAGARAPAARSSAIDARRVAKVGGTSGIDVSAALVCILWRRGSPRLSSTRPAPHISFRPDALMLRSSLLSCR